VLLRSYSEISRGGIHPLPESVRGVRRQLDPPPEAVEIFRVFLNTQTLHLVVITILNTFKLKDIVVFLKIP